MSQWDTAKARGNLVRSSNAALQREIKAMSTVDGKAHVAALLLAFGLTDPVGALPVDRLLCSIHGVAKGGTLAILTNAEIKTVGGTLRVRDLAVLERQRIAAELQRSELVCRDCQSPLRHRSKTGRCGFCDAEIEAAA